MESNSSFTSDEDRYAQLMARQQREWEAKCNNCGTCCGIAEHDPCEHLVRISEGQYTCQIYENRFGYHKTVSGRDFKCVPLRNILHKSWPGDHLCAYKKQ